MAKLKAPLFSLGAAGAIGKALVFFGWKGLNVVREYVVPANPKTTAQGVQRTYLTNAVAAIHAAQARPTLPLGSVDVSAYALWGSTYPTPRTWFNQAVKNYLDQAVANKSTAVYRGGGVGEHALHLDINIYSLSLMPGKILAGKFWYGTSKTALINSIDAVITAASEKAYADIITLAAKTKYFIQFRPTTTAYLGSNSGIYYGTTD